MLEIITPDLETTRRIQESQGRYYWSRCADLLFRREGIISVRRVEKPSSDNALKIFCRDTLGDIASIPGSPQVLEGPVSGTILKKLGLSGRVCHTEMLNLDNEAALALHLPEIRVRLPDKSTAPLKFKESDAKWRNRSFEVQFLDGAGWEPVLLAACPDTGVEGAIAVRRGSLMLIGCPLFDVLVRWLAVPPLAERYDGFTRGMRHDLISARIVSLILEHAESAGGIPLRVSRWPRGYTSALTIRHDYDRPAPMAKLRMLLEQYRRSGMRASIGFLPYLMEREAMEAFRADGHEIQAHVASPTRLALREDLRRLRGVANDRVAGVTIHGGPGGIGFRGQTHFEWFDDAGLEYCETFGIRDTIPAPVCRLYDDVPDSSCMVATSGHMSMDGSTRPDDHRLESLRGAVPASLARGNYVIVMNHPDLHHQQVCALVSQLDLRTVWLTTTLEAVRWHRVTRYTSHVGRAPGGYHVVFDEVLPHDATINAGKVDVTVAAGTRDILIPLAR